MAAGDVDDAESAMAKKGVVVGVVAGVVGSTVADAIGHAVERGFGTRAWDGGDEAGDAAHSS